MITPYRLILPLLLALLISGCGERHLIKERKLRQNIEEEFSARAAMYGDKTGNLFALAAGSDSIEVREAATFLLAYMPMSDLAHYDRNQLLSTITSALTAREATPWGRKIPSSLFLNFVLPPRVNNENPDEFRETCRDELLDRVSGLTAVEAALEVNRWCQEKVAYQAADSRTSSPLATILSARGRCGEESTLTVSALRAVSIPARQVYTPRWAHTDDNHAWVEFWADGRWHYLGACEPEPVPDRGWFTEPARRAMMVHTKSFGLYEGNEKVIRRERFFTELNTLERYAVTKELKVRVTDPSGEPVPGATTGYMIYNYAEFYPLAQLTSDDQGESSLTTGLGTLLIWADDGERYGFSPALPDQREVTVVISPRLPEETTEIDVMVPVVPTPFPEIDPLLVEENNRVIVRGDSIRNQYIASWMRGINIADLAEETGIEVDLLEDLLRRSMGNWRDITGFLMHAGGKGDLALRLLRNVSSKDLRDTPADILADHLDNAPEPLPGSDPALYDPYVLSPRISNEMLTPFRSLLLAALPEGFVVRFRDNPAAAAAWVDKTIRVNNDENHYRVPIVPGGVLKLMMADSHSREIFLVALLRSAGVPSRLAPGTGRPQYHYDGVWNDVWFSDETGASGSPGFITFVNGSDGEEPEYHVHFSLARLEGGRYTTLDYGYEVRLSALPKHIALDPGSYMLTTGNRDENGNVMASLSFFELTAGQELSLTISPRILVAGTPASGATTSGSLTGGSADLSEVVAVAGGEGLTLSSLATEGLVMIWIEPEREPTRHLLNDLPGLKGELDRWNGRFIVLTDPAVTPVGFDPSAIDGMPENTLFATDRGLRLLEELSGGAPARSMLPVVLYTASDGTILFSSEGYRIGTGRQLLSKLTN